MKPGRGTVKVRFHIPDDEIEEIRTYVAIHRKTTRNYLAEVYDFDGTLVAKVEKELYIRKVS